MNLIALVGSARDTLLVRALAAAVSQPRVVLLIEPEPPPPPPDFSALTGFASTLAHYLKDAVLPCAPPPWTELCPLTALAPLCRLRVHPFPSVVTLRFRRWLLPPTREPG